MLHYSFQVVISEAVLRIRQTQKDTALGALGTSLTLALHHSAVHTFTGDLREMAHSIETYIRTGQWLMTYALLLRAEVVFCRTTGRTLAPRRLADFAQTFT